MEDGIDTKQFILTMRQIAEEKNLDFEVVKDALEQALAAAYRKDFGTRDQNVRVSLNTKSGDYKVFVVHEVVEEVEEPESQWTLAEAKEHKSSAKVGDIIEQEVKDKPFGRVAAQTAKQVILQKLREAEREVVHGEFSSKIGTILNGTVQRVEPRVVYIDLGKAQGILPASEQIPHERYSPGQRIKVYLRDVETSARGPQLILSRANPEFISLLFEREVPEMENNAVEIRAIEREAGVRTKVAVASTVPGVDPVGTFVGGHGTRVQAVMNEVGEEKIDIIPFAEDAKEFITNALSPTKINAIELDEAEKKAVVKVDEDQLSVAIGKNGQNVRLASKISGWQIDINGDATEAAESKPAVSDPIPEPVPTKVSAKPKKPASKQALETALLETIDQAGSEPEEGGTEPATENAETAAQPLSDSKEAEQPDSTPSPSEKS
jgi:transcription termination/antitermination protein NusA